MLTIYPQLLRNFVYKLPGRCLSLLGLVDSLRFIFSRDLMVAEVRAHIHPAKCLAGSTCRFYGRPRPAWSSCNGAFRAWCSSAF